MNIESPTLWAKMDNIELDALRRVALERGRAADVQAHIQHEVDALREQATSAIVSSGTVDEPLVVTSTFDVLGNEGERRAQKLVEDIGADSFIVSTPDAPDDAAAFVTLMDHNVHFTVDAAHSGMGEQRKRIAAHEDIHQNCHSADTTGETEQSPAEILQKHRADVLALVSGNVSNEQLRQAESLTHAGTIVENPVFQTTWDVHLVDAQETEAVVNGDGESANHPYTEMHIHPWREALQNLDDAGLNGATHELDAGTPVKFLEVRKKQVAAKVQEIVKVSAPQGDYQLSA